MQLDRTKNAKKSILFGFIQKVVSLFLPFVIRTVIIYYLGMAYAGISTLFGSVLSVLSLAELGFGTAVVFSMYKPIAEDDTDTICALINFYKKCYRVIGLVILLIGGAITPFIPYLIKSTCPDDINIYIVYILSLLSVVTSYLLFAYRGVLFAAHQRNDVTSSINTIVLIIQYGTQILLLILLRNYYVYPIIALAMTIVNNLVVAVVSKKAYPQYMPTGKLKPELREEVITKVKSLFLYKVGNVVSNSVDNIVISAFLGLTVLALYGNYYYVISTLFGFLGIYYASMTAGLGNKIVLDAKEDNYKLFENLFFSQGWIVGWMTTCLICLYQDFICLWVGREAMFTTTMVLLLGAYFYSWKINDIVHIFKDAAGLWEYDRLRPLISSGCNLVVNIVLIKFIGIYGVVISTIVCELLFSLLWGTRILFDKYFELSFSKYLLKLLKYTVVNLFVLGATYFICCGMVFDSAWAQILVKIAICLFVPNILYVLIYRKSVHFQWFTNKLKSFVKF